MQIITRDEWGAARPKSRTPLPVDALDGVTYHWFGSPSQAATHARCDDLLCAVQRGHQAGEYVDIAYNHAVCPHGYAYELRGFGVQAGANGTTRANQSHAAIVFMMGKGDPPLPLGALEVGARLRQEYLDRGCGTAVRPHGFWTGSECPGAQVSAWIARRGYQLAPTPTPTKEETMIPDWLGDFVVWVVRDQRAPGKRPANVPKDLRPWAPAIWELATDMARVADQAGMSEEERAWIHWRLVDGQDPEKRPGGLAPRIPPRWWPDAEAVHKIANAYAESA